VKEEEKKNGRIRTGKGKFVRVIVHIGCHVGKITVKRDSGPELIQ
jgi:hypothetical protein